ncbi:MAG: zinc-binding alcohol dehydrogenase [Steroidobacteraceae bacterium]
MPHAPAVASRAQSFWIAAPGRGELRATTLPAPTADEVLVRALYSGVSRGTESLVFLGRVPASEHARMRCPFQEGEFPAPLKYGYASVGVVERGPVALRDRVVFCLHPHQTHYVVPAAAAVPLPAGVPAGRAVLAANLETAVNALWDAGPRIGDAIAVVGAGVLGALVAWLAARIPGCRVQLIDREPRRAALAQALGVAFATPAEAQPGMDLVLHASGAPGGLELALQLAAFEACVVELSWYGEQTVPLALGGAFHSQRLQLRSSQVGHVAAPQRARWSQRRRLELALALLAAPELDALISGEDEFSALPSLMPRLAAAAGDALCHRIRYTGSA